MQKEEKIQGLSKTELKRIIRELREYIKYLEKNKEENEVAHKSILWAVLDEDGKDQATCPMCFKMFKNLNKYEEHLTKHREDLKK